MLSQEEERIVAIEREMLAIGRALLTAGIPREEALRQAKVRIKALRIEQDALIAQVGLRGRRRRHEPKLWPER